MPSVHRQAALAATTADADLWTDVLEQLRVVVFVSIGANP